jgi:hypothetical protein
VGTPFFLFGLAAANHNKKIMPKKAGKKHKKNGGLLITRRLAVR